MNYGGWFVKLITDVGSIQFPFGSSRGYRTKEEAEFVAGEAMKVPGAVRTEIRRGDQNEN